jgi:hypothetical protein
MRRTTQQARLYLNDVDVGAVTVKGWDGAWGLGEFDPGAAFPRFAPHFGLWSLLMHVDEADDSLSEAATEELRRAERQIDGLHAELLLVETGQRRPISQLTIDGDMVEWVELYFHRPDESHALDSDLPV